jgi:uncharacterized membrane protein YphA (DoxX/SURF4 family)
MNILNFERACLHTDHFVDHHGKKIGRVLIGLLFLISGVAILMSFKGFTSAVDAFFPFPTLMAICAVVMKIGGGLSLILGLRTRVGAYVLILFTMTTVFFVHTPSFFTAQSPLSQQTEIISILKNLAIIGGLILVSR